MGNVKKACGSEMMQIKHDKIGFLLVPSLVLLICTLFPAAQAHTQTEELKVKKAVERFYLYFSQHQYERMWAMLSQGVKEGNDNNKSRYVRELNQTRLLRLSIKIKAVKVEGSRATVTFVMQMQSDAAADSSSKTHEETHEDVWVKEKGKWLFDGSRTLSESLTTASQVERSTTTISQR